MTQPLVSCIMPTYNRRKFVQLAIRYFLHQDYANKELIIIDDGADVIRDIVPDDSRFRYVRLNHRKTIGVKRNIACRASKGEIIVHWDDDDWYAPWRLSYQVRNLVQDGVDICGLEKLVFFNPKSGQAWQYIYPKGGRPWVAGGTLCYNKDFWRRNQFPDINVGEDGQFLWSEVSKKILALHDYAFYVAMIHDRNTSPKDCSGSYWSPWNEDLSLIMGEALGFYRSSFQESDVGESLVEA